MAKKRLPKKKIKGKKKGFLVGFLFFLPPPLPSLFPLFAKNSSSLIFISSLFHSLIIHQTIVVCMCGGGWQKQTKAQKRQPKKKKKTWVLCSFPFLIGPFLSPFFSKTNYSLLIFDFCFIFFSFVDPLSSSMGSLLCARWGE